MNKILRLLLLGMLFFQAGHGLAQSKWAYVETNTTDGVRVGILLDDGSLLIDMVYEEIVFAGNNFYCKQDGLWGCIGREGSIILPLGYEDIGYGFSEGLFRVMRNGKWGFVDSEGNVRIGFIYDFACNFKKGRAYVKKDGEDYYIRPSGRRAGRAKEELYYCTDGLGCTAELSNQFESDTSLHVISEKGLYGVSGPGGKVIIPADCDQIGFYFNDIITFARGDLWGAYRNDGTLISEPRFSYISFFNGWKTH